MDRVERAQTIMLKIQITFSCVPKRFALKMKSYCQTLIANNVQTTTILTRVREAVCKILVKKTNSSKSMDGVALVKHTHVKIQMTLEDV